MRDDVRERVHATLEEMLSSEDWIDRIKVRLKESMEEISEGRWSAGWVHNLEVILWEEVLDGGYPDLRILSEMVDGWWIYPKITEGMKFVSLDRWKAIFEERSAERDRH